MFGSQRRRGRGRGRGRGSFTSIRRNNYNLLSFRFVGVEEK
jgi:hypothetical protein